MMIEPFQSDEAFLRDVAQHRGGGPHLWWLGQSGFLIAHEGHCALLDPYLSESLTEKYRGTDKPHVRMTRRVVDPRMLDFIGSVAVTHNHTDHLDARTLKPLLDANADLAVIVPRANRVFAADRLGVDPLELLVIDDGETVQTPGFSFTAVPAAHETIERDQAGGCHFLGYVVRAGDWVIYHSGDTIRYDGMAEWLAPFKIDVALLPINGRAPERRVAGNLNGREAAQLARDIGAGMVIPCHYEMFEFNTAPPDQFVVECWRLGQPFTHLRAGERLSANQTTKPGLPPSAIK